MTAPAGQSPPSRPIRVLLLALLALATFAVFAGVLRNGWILFDDPEYVLTQPQVVRGLRLDGALWFLTHAHGANWHPLTSWSHLLDVQLFGLSPTGHHATSLLLHALNAVLLVLVLFRLTGAWWRSLAVGALFALHPLRVESVAWIAERKDVLSGLFFLLVLEAYRRWVERPSRGRQAALLLVFALGLMSKPMLVTLPAVLLLLDRWPLGRWRTGNATAASPPGAPAKPFIGLVAEKWPLFALAAVSSLVTFLVQQRGGAVMEVEAIAPLRRVANAALSYARYVRDTLWPHDLAVFYPYHPATDWAAAAACGLGLVGVTAWCAYQWRRRPYLATGWFWYVGMLVPVIGFLQVGSQAYADRYTYLPTIGLLVALVWLAGDLVARWRIARAAAAVALVAALAALSVGTWRQVAHWKDTKTLFTWTLAVTHGNPVAHQALGSALAAEGSLPEAIVELRAALRLAPAFPDAHTNLGSALGMQGHDEEAIAHFRAALAVRDRPDVHHNIGLSLEKLGRTDEAIAEYETAVRGAPPRALTRVLLAKALASRGRVAEAETHLRRALESEPGQVEARRLMAVVLTVQGRVEEAIGEYERLLDRDPDDLDALNNIAWIRATHADPVHRSGTEAVRLAERAVAKSPRPEVLLESTMAAAYAEAGRFPDAVQAGERALALARAGGDARVTARIADQLAHYRAGRPFHFAP